MAQQAEIIAEDEVTLEYVSALLKQSRFVDDVNVDEKNEEILVYFSELMRIVVDIYKDERVLNFTTMLPLEDIIDEDITILGIRPELINGLNRTLLIGRFYIPGDNPGVLAADYALPFIGCISTAQILAAFEMFAAAVVTGLKIIVSADEDGMLG